MSDYASSHRPRQEYAGLQGTLFDHLETDLPHEVKDNVVTIEPEPKFVQSRELPSGAQVYKEEVLRRDLTRASVHAILQERAMTPYEDINPSIRHIEVTLALPHEKPLDSVMRHFEPWQKEIVIAVDRLAVLDLTPDLVGLMTVRERGRLGRRLEQLMIQMRSRPKLIRTMHGDMTHASFYGDYGSVEPDAMMEYASNLAMFRDALLNFRAVQLLLSEAAILQPNPHRRKEAARLDKEKNGELQVYFELNRQGDKQPYVTDLRSVHDL